MHGKGEGVQAGAAACAPVLVVDDDSDLRRRIASVLARAGFATSEAATGEEALDSARREPPALVVLDVCLPGICGYEVFRELRDEFGDGLPVVFVSGARTQSYDRVAGLLLGADDYLVKPFALDELLLRVRRLVHRSRPARTALASRLTSREQEVFGLLAEGLGHAQIASRLYISRKTVGSHVEHIFRKLGVHSRAEAVALASQERPVGTAACT
jgi:two-component system nitrate/nitrite response regulator NarL